MSIIHQVSNADLNDNWRTINIDALDPESSSNFDTSTLHPAFAPVSENEARSIGQQVRQLLRGGDAEGALRGALESAPYGGDASVKVRSCVETLRYLRGVGEWSEVRATIIYELELQSGCETFERVGLCEGWNYCARTILMKLVLIVLPTGYPSPNCHGGPAKYQSERDDSDATTNFPE